MTFPHFDRFTLESTIQSHLKLIQMGKYSPYYLVLVTFIFLQLSCKKEVGSGPEHPEYPDGVILKDAQVVVPPGMNYDLAGHQVLHSGQILPVGVDGKTRVVDNKGRSSIAYLFNRDNEPVMAGFITDTTVTISPETTAKVVLYYAIGVPFQWDTATHIFINRIHEVQGVSDWISGFTAAWKSDPKTLIKGGYQQSLRDWLTARTQELPAAGISNKGSVHVDANDVRSGLRLHPEGLGLSITNTYRRRAAAYAYKMKYKQEGSSTYTTVLSSIGLDNRSDLAFMVDPASGLTSVVGEVWKNIRGNGMQTAAVTSGPVSLELKENETEALYNVRVVGPGNGDPTKLTSVEMQEVILQFTMTLAADFVGPMVGSAFGVVNHYHGDAMLKIFYVDMPKMLPGFIESWFAGDIKKVFLTALDLLMSEYGFDLYKKYIEEIFKAGNLPLPANFEDLARKGQGILMAIDFALLGGDFVRIAHNIDNSKLLEEWEVTVRENKVTLMPNESAVSIFAPANKQELEATVQNLTDADAKKMTYEWRVKGKFGTLADGRGQSGTSFKSSEKKVTFTSTNDPGLTDDDNWEDVYVTAYLDDKPIGNDTARINVRKTRYELLPEGVTLSGKEGQTNSVILRLSPVNNIGSTIGTDPDWDYKIVWETAGVYGGFDLGYTGIEPNMTTYNVGSIKYVCEDDKVKNASETVSARIYARKKGRPDSEYRVIDYVKATVKINNDEKKKFLHIPLQCSHGDTIYNNGQSITCMIITYASFKAEPEAKSYSVRFYDVRWPKSYSWNAGSSAPANIDNYVVRASPGVFNIEYGASWAVGPLAYANHRTCGQGALGMAEVTITLK